MKNKTRFDLEQELFDCWHITDDLEMLFEAVMDQDLDKDKIANIILGLQQLYHLKFDRTFNTFESLIHNEFI